MSRLVLPLTTIVALIATAMMFAPIGAAQHGADQYLFGKDANVDKPIHGSLQVYGGNAYIHAPINGDLLVIGATSLSPILARSPATWSTAAATSSVPRDG